MAGVVVLLPMSSSPQPGASVLNDLSYRRVFRQFVQMARAFPDPPDRASVREWHLDWSDCEVCGALAFVGSSSLYPLALGRADRTGAPGQPGTVEHAWSARVAGRLA